MSVKKSDSVSIVNPFLRRLRANSAFSREFVYVNTFKSKSPMYDLEKSKTDREAHRVTLASMRSSILQQKGSSSSVGQYGFKAGTSIDEIRKYDDSYFRRPDLTLADIDAALSQLKEQCENLDEQNKISLQEEIERAESIKAALQAAENKDNQTSSTNSASE